MKFWMLLIPLAAFVGQAYKLTSSPPLHSKTLWCSMIILWLPQVAYADASPAQGLVDAAKGQIGETIYYDPAYVGLTFPNGDIDRRRGVCSDVIVRALRDWRQIDLQTLLNVDMQTHFDTYPKIWNLTKPDPNIDHRRVPNLRRYFERMGFERPITQDPRNYLAGDIVTWSVPENHPHIGIVSDKRKLSGRPLIIHNIGRGTVEDDILFRFEITGHYRLDRGKLSN